MSAIALGYQSFYKFPSLDSVDTCNRDTGSVDSLMSTSFKRLCIWLQSAELILRGESFGIPPPTARDYVRVNVAVPILEELSEAVDDYTDANRRGDSIVETLANKILSLVNSLPRIKYEPEEQAKADCDDDKPKDQEVVDHNGHHSAQCWSPASSDGEDEEEIRFRNLYAPRFPRVGPELAAAAEAGDSNAVARLLEQAEVRPWGDKIAKLGGHTLIAAAKAGHIEVVDMLSKAGISVDEYDEHGQTALLYAVRRHDGPLIDLLIDRRITTALPNRERKTGLEVAIEEGDRDIIIRVLDKYTWSHTPRAWDQTPVQWARTRGHEAAAAILEEMQERLLRREMMEKWLLDYMYSMYDEGPAKIEQDGIEGPQEGFIRGDGWYAFVKPQPQGSSFDVELVSTSKPGFPVRFAALRRPSDAYTDYFARESKAWWAAETGKGLPGKVDHPISYACVSRDEQTVAAAYGRVVKVYDAATEQVRCRLQFDHHVDAIDLSTTGHVLVSAQVCVPDSQFSSYIRVFDVETGGWIADYALPLDREINCFKLSPDGQFVAAACRNRDEVHIFDLRKTQRSPHQLVKHETRIHYMAFSSDGKYLAIAGGHQLSVWNWALGEKLFDTHNFWHETTAVSFTPDDRWVVSASDDGCVRFWGREDGTLQCTLAAHAGVIRYLAFDKDGRFTTASSCKAVRVWSYRGRDGTERERGGKGDESDIPHAVDLQARFKEPEESRKQEESEESKE
ncbi:WD40-repeat-containing/Ankyrin domain-containing protein [Trichoderma gracile]